jgi:hypothetical protein
MFCIILMYVTMWTAKRRSRVTPHVLRISPLEHEETAELPSIGHIALRDRTDAEFTLSRTDPQDHQQ